MCLGVLGTAVVAVTGGDNRHAELLAVANELLVHLGLPGDIREIHELEVEIVLPEEGAVLLDELLQALGIFSQSCLRNRAADGSAECDESLAVLREELGVHTRLVVHAFERREGRQLQQVLVALLRFGKECQRVALRIDPALLIFSGAGCDVHFYS